MKLHIVALFALMVQWVSGYFFNSPIKRANIATISANKMKNIGAASLAVLAPVTAANAADAGGLAAFSTPLIISALTIPIFIYYANGKLFPPRYQF